MSPRSTAQLDEIRNQRRQEILEAALELFAKQGYHNTSIEQIRKKAGVSKGLIYTYFDKKEDLLNGVIFDAATEKKAYLMEIMNQQTPADRARMIIDVTLDYMRDNYEHARLISQLSFQLDLEEFQSIRDIILQGYAQNMPFMVHIMEELGFEDPQMEALAFMATLRGAGTQYLILKEAYDLEHVRSYMIQRYCPNTETAHLSEDNEPQPPQDTED